MLILVVQRINQSLSFLPAHLLTPQWQPINVYHYARAPFASSAAPSFVLFMLSGFNVPWQCGNVTRYSQHATSCHCIFCIRTPHRQSSVQPSHPYTAPPVSAPPYTFTATAFICSTAPLLIHFRFQSSAVLLAASSLLSPRSRRRHSCQVSSPFAAAYFRAWPLPFAVVQCFCGSNWPYARPHAVVREIVTQLTAACLTLSHRRFIHTQPSQRNVASS